LTRPEKFPKSQAEALIRDEAGLSGPCRWQPLHGDGSERIFYRVTTQNGSLIVVWRPPEDDQFPNENDSYVYMGKHLAQKGIPVPRIYAYLRSEGLTLVEDLGSIHLQQAVRSTAGEFVRLYHQAVELLLSMQACATEDLDTHYCFDTPVYDPVFVVWRELDYFQQSFLQGALGLESHSYDLELEFSTLASRAGAGEGHLFFLHRDFQSRNLMLKADVLHVIDFQGARLGPPQYDLAALLLDPYVQLSQSSQQELLTAYCRRFSVVVGVSAGEFMEKYPHVALCRNLQILAAFAFLTKTRLRSHFAQYILPAWQQLQRLLAVTPCSDYRGLVRLVQSQSEETIARVAARMEREAQSAGGQDRQDRRERREGETSNIPG
jgi:aminoglycoside/choline kinase family phosphotransferase